MSALLAALATFGGMRRAARPYRLGSIIAQVAATTLVAAASMGVPAHGQPTQLQLARLHVQHVLIIMQENRSFDEYFGTFPGADGIPQGVCVPKNPSEPVQGCVAPFHNTLTLNEGGPHTASSFWADYGNGAMNGFVFQQESIPYNRTCTTPPSTPECKGALIGDVMGYHTGAEIPNYWRYAKTFTLLDHLFEPVANWSYPSHLQLVSGWYAKCSANYALSCEESQTLLYSAAQVHAWTHLPYLLDKAKVSWRYYLSEGAEPDCSDGEATCAPQLQRATVPGIWNPIPAFTLFQQAVSSNPAYASHVTPFDSLLVDIKGGTLPSVAWIVPSQKVSEHPAADIEDGQAYVTSIVNAIAQSPYAANTLIIIAWDDWGGFYDHVLPPVAQTFSLAQPKNPTGAKPPYGWGFRVPGILIDAYAKPGFVDHADLSFDNFNRLIEDLFLNSQRLDPKTDGRPDLRAAVSEAITQVKDPVSGATIPVGDLLNDFNFSQTAIPIPVLPTYPPK